MTSPPIPDDKHWQRVLIWLGKWRDKMPAEAVDHLHAIVDVANPDTEPKDDVAEVFASADTMPPAISTLRRIIEALRDSAMEAEVGFETSCYRVTILERHGLTDSSDPAFGPVKYPDQGKPPGDVLPF